MNILREHLEDILKDIEGGIPYNFLCVAIKLPTGGKELIINHSNIKYKVNYYLNNYDEELRLKHNPNISISGILAG